MPSHLMEREQQAKRLLLQTWLKPWMLNNSVQIFTAGIHVHNDAVIKAMAKLPQGNPVKQYIYLLLMNKGEGVTPLYIGRARNPINRWKQHLKGLLHGQEPYQRWHKVLLNDDGTAKHDTQLVVIPVEEVSIPPIPGFPITVGALEYQLIGLANDAHPGSLLNHEGSSR